MSGVSQSRQNLAGSALENIRERVQPSAPSNQVAILLPLWGQEHCAYSGLRES
jgi:hypothetical protein